MFRVKSNQPISLSQRLCTGGGIRCGSFVVFLLTAGQVMAITNGQPDGDDHPYVGLAVFDDANGDPMWRCSGALLSPTLFLTAGHCTEAPAASATVWFESDVEAGIPDNGYPFGGPTSVDGTPFGHPQYDPNRFLLYDLGVVVLDEPVFMDDYAVLPEEGLLDSLATRRGLQDQTITAVGYGLQRINPVFVEADRIRMQASLKLVNETGFGRPGDTIFVSANAHTGGTCFGDSGGPQFLGDSNVVAAVTSYGLNGNCAGIGGGYRVDQADDLDWLYGQFGDHLSVGSIAAAPVPEPGGFACLLLMGLAGLARHRSRSLFNAKHNAVAKPENAAHGPANLRLARP